MSEEDYESLPPSSGMATHMLAGAAAGVLEHCTMYPIDCIKTRMQCLVPDPRANYRNVVDAMYRIVRYEGIANSFRGINAMAYGAGPAHALYFACYEYMKKSLSKPGHSNHLAHGAAGVCATLLHDAVMNPADVVKQRMQMYNSPYKSCLQCLRQVYAKEGTRAFYRSYTTQLSMNIPFQSIHFMVYEFCQDELNPQRSYHPHTHWISGALAGAFAAAATTPLDVCKTLLNTQEKCAVSQPGASVDGLVQAFRTVYQYQGMRGYFRGVSARIIYQMPSTAISWLVYEFFKFRISRSQDGLVPAPQVHCAPRPSQ
eukprot:GHVO01020456.1.p1 GENE.GHVO01020456.1~~GHVO01020456.1.p1  ORF type:complete len:314 (-),score=23.27 GHVO01020456.1:585-1526(-)